jgi:hypothetical protein
MSYADLAEEECRKDVYGAVCTCTLTQVGTLLCMMLVRVDMIGMYSTCYDYGTEYGQ